MPSFLSDLRAAHTGMGEGRAEYKCRIYAHHNSDLPTVRQALILDYIVNINTFYFPLCLFLLLFFSMIKHFIIGKEVNFIPSTVMSIVGPAIIGKRLIPLLLHLENESCSFGYFPT